MRQILFAACLLGLCTTILGRPPRREYRDQPMQPETTHGINGTEDWNLGVDYNRYLQEVVQVLESDPAFRKKLETADVEKIRDGSIANELDFVNHNIRSRLDDIKRRELERLRHLAMRQFELSEGIDKRHIKIPSHIEVQSPTFEKDDLIRLIKSTTKDLEEADRKRKDEFKHYEMEKKFEQQERLSHIEDAEKRKLEETKLKEQEEKHKKHEKPHHPMTKDQLEEVWEDNDHMRPEDWDPKTFFAMHDLNGDGFWDEDEIRTLFKKELDKVYDPNAPEDDMRERREEMERMREHVFKESDKNKDRLISYDEFLIETKRDEFAKDPGWNTIDQDEQDDFSDDEFRAYEMQRQREIQDMLNRGVVPPGYPYYGAVPQGAAPYHPPPLPGHGSQPQLGIPGQAAYNPQQNYQQQQQQYAGQGQQYAGQVPHQGAQYAGQPQQFGGQPQQFAGQPQQFAGQPQQFSGQPQQFAGQAQQQQGKVQQLSGQPQPHQDQAPLAQPQQPSNVGQAQAGQPVVSGQQQLAQDAVVQQHQQAQVQLNP